MSLMEIKELLSENTGTLLVIVAIAMTLIEVTPIKVNPWSAFGRWIGRIFNGDVLKKLDTLEKGQHETRKRLDEHIRVDDERDANLHRQRILRFNADLMKGDDCYTHEYFVDVLQDIDEYEDFCRSHPGYKNNRAVMAIANIKRVYEQHEKDEDFLI